MVEPTKPSNESHPWVTNREWPCICGGRWDTCNVPDNMTSGARWETWPPHEVRPLEQAFREFFPPGRSGYVTGDTDVSARLFGPSYGLDSLGSILDVYVKSFGKTPTDAERFSIEARNSDRTAGAIYMKLLGGNTFLMPTHFPAPLFGLIPQQPALARSVRIGSMMRKGNGPDECRKPFRLTFASTQYHTLAEMFQDGTLHNIIMDERIKHGLLPA